MPKRFTASEKWDDPWFRRLSPEMKLFWIYLLDRCNVAGIWDADIDLAQFYVGKELALEEIRSTFRGRIIVLPDGKWFVPKFITFQYGQLSMTNPAHKNVIAILKRHRFIEADLRFNEAPRKLLQSSFKAPKDKDKIKAKA